MLSLPAFIMLSKAIIGVNKTTILNHLNITYTINSKISVILLYYVCIKIQLIMVHGCKCDLLHVPLIVLLFFECRNTHNARYSQMLLRVCAYLCVLLDILKNHFRHHIDILYNANIFMEQQLL